MFETEMAINFLTKRKLCLAVLTVLGKVEDQLVTADEVDIFDFENFDENLKLFKYSSFFFRNFLISSLVACFQICLFSTLANQANQPELPGFSESKRPELFS